MLRVLGLAVLASLACSGCTIPIHAYPHMYFLDVDRDGREDLVIHVLEGRVREVSWGDYGLEDQPASRPFYYARFSKPDLLTQESWDFDRDGKPDLTLDYGEGGKPWTLSYPRVPFGREPER